MADEEAAVARVVDNAGLSAPRLLEMVLINGRPGLVYERVDGRPMLAEVTSRPWRVGLRSRELAQLHTKMLGTTGTGLPSQKARLARAIESGADTLGAPRLRAVLGILESLPDGHAICHGDLHPGNVVMTRTGAVVIDWMTATSGAPEADIARTLFLLAGTAIPDDVPRITRLVINTMRYRFADLYLRHLRQLFAVDEHLLVSWRSVVLAARLAEGIAEETAMLLSQVDAGLATTA